MDETYVWRAYGGQNRDGPIAGNPRAAAVGYFARYPKSRKCDVQEYQQDRPGVLKVRYDLTGKGRRPGFHRDVTRKQAEALPTC